MPKQELISSHSRPVSIGLTLLLFFVLMFMNVGRYAQTGNFRMAAPAGAYVIFLTVLAFLIFRTGRISRYRSLFFSVYAVGFILTFIPALLETRGHLALTGKNIANLDTPLCHLTIPMLILPGVVHGILIFPTKLFSNMGFFPMLFLWIGATVTLGKGWCSWGCFYGGLDEMFSKLSAKRILSTKRFNEKLRWFPFALLAVIVVWAFLAMEPVYCTWLCPFKAVTEYPEPVNALIWFQTGLFIVLFLGLVVVLPFLTKRRIQCGLFCPFGAFQAAVGTINPYRVRIDGEACTRCGACVEACPTFAITKETLARNRTSITCSRCGRCMEVCPKRAIRISLLGVPLRKPEEGRGFRRVLSEIFRPDTLFVFTALLFGGVMSGSMVSEALLRFVHLATTGSFLFK
jgi:ferredoxin-type protein NapH